MNDKITVSKLINKIKGLNLVTNDKTLEREITVSEISRPGLELTGYFKYFANLRTQVIGLNEGTYLEKIDYADEVLDKFLNPSVPVIVFCREMTPPQKVIDLANERGIAIVVTKRATSKIYSEIFNYLEYELAPQTQVHGVLVSVYGHGVLIKGGSGIGKSEVALELIKRDHFLVADDAVVLRQIDDEFLVGTAPKLLKNRLEIRGVGIVDIQKLYGVTKVLSQKRVSLVVELKDLDGKEDRIGSDILVETYLGVDVPKIQIPITAGRSISNLIEVATANFELKTYHGVDSAEEFVNDLNNLLVEGNNG